MAAAVGRNSPLGPVSRVQRTCRWNASRRSSTISGCQDAVGPVEPAARVAELAVTHAGCLGEVDHGLPDAPEAEALALLERGGEPDAEALALSPTWDLIKRLRVTVIRDRSARPWPSKRA